MAEGETVESQNEATRVLAGEENIINEIFLLDEASSDAAFYDSDMNSDTDPEESSREGHTSSTGNNRL